MNNFKNILAEALTAYNLSCDEDKLNKFTTYYNMVVEINQFMNLTAITEPKEFAIKHIVDCLSCYDEKYFQKNCRLIDVGTGAGFPGIVLAIWNEELQITLFDSLQKRLKFLDEVIMKLNLKNVTTLHGRAEDMAHDKNWREKFDIATSRAVARMPILLEWCLPFIKNNGYFIALKGAQYQEECQESERALKILKSKIVETKAIKLPELDDKRAVIYIQKNKTINEEYPRKLKLIKNAPLV